MLDTISNNGVVYFYCCKKFYEIKIILGTNTIYEFINNKNYKCY